MSNPLISIVIPVFNAEKYISETLDSLIKQTYSNWECFIIDDGSTDHSKDIIQEYCKKDNRFHYFYQENSGPSVARNNGLKLVEGEYIQFLDADDVLMPERFDVLLQEYTKAESNIILYSDLWLGKNENIYEKSIMLLPASLEKDLSFNEMYRYFAVKFIFIPACILFPANSLKGKTWNTSLNHSEDWDFYLSVLNQSEFVFRFVPKKLVIYRNTLTGLSKNTLKTIEANYKILYRWKNSQSKDYIIRVSKLFSKNITSRIFNKTDKIILPPFNKKSFLSSILIYFIVWIYIGKWFWIWISKKLK